MFETPLDTIKNCFIYSAGILDAEIRAPMKPSYGYWAI